MRLSVRPAIAGVAALMLFVVACAEPVTPGIPNGASRVADDEVDTLAREHFSGATSSARVVVTTPEEWAAVWEWIYAPYTPKPALPAVDFAQSVVVVASLSERSSGGYGIDVDDVYRTDSEIVVELRETAPGSSCVVTAALTQPVVAVRVPRGAGDITFVERRSEQECS